MEEDYNEKFDDFGTQYSQRILEIENVKLIIINYLVIVFGNDSCIIVK